MSTNTTRRLLPVGMQDFVSVRKDGFVYVDKTARAHELITGSGRQIFLSRPRRFGKSLLTLFTLLTAAQIQAQAQEVPQSGIVRELSISTAAQGKPVADALLLADGEARSGKDGRFVLKLTPGKDSTFVFKEISKEGYTLISPKTGEIVSINPSEPIVVTLIKNDLLPEERARALDPEKEDYPLEYGEFLYFASRYGDALKVYERVLSAALKNGGEADEFIAKMYNRIGLVHFDRGDTRALENHEKALGIYKLIFGGEHPYTAESYNYIGLAYHTKGDNSKALEYHQKALGIYESVYGSEHSGVAESYNRIGAVYSDSDSLQEALEYHQKALALFEKAFLGRHPEVAQSYNNIGMVYCGLRDYPKALEYYQKALAIFEEVFGDGHLNVADVWTNIGTVYSGRGDYSKALEYYQKAVALMESVSGGEYANAATMYHLIGLAHWNEHRAVEYLQKAVEIRKKQFGSEHPKVATLYTCMGSIYENIDYKQSMEYLQKALKINESAFGSEHPKMAATYNNIGSVYYGREDYPRALEYFKKAAKAEEMAHKSGDHPALGMMYDNIGTTYYVYGDSPMALEYYLMAERLFGIEHPRMERVYEHIRDTYRRHGDYPMVLEYYKIERAALEKRHGSDAPEVAELSDIIESLNSKQYKYNYSTALGCYQKALELREEELGSEHPDTKAAYANLVGCLYSATMAGGGEKALAKGNAKRLDSLMKARLFTADAIEGKRAAFEMGLRGTYKVLYFEGWECTGKPDLIAHSETVKDKSKKLILMKDGVVTEHQFGSGATGLRLGLSAVTKKDKKAVVDRYKKWKKKGK